MFEISQLKEKKLPELQEFHWEALHLGVSSLRECV